MSILLLFVIFYSTFVFLSTHGKSLVKHNSSSLSIEPFTNCMEYSLSWNGCKNPMEAECNPVEGKCSCRDESRLYKEGFCLPRFKTIKRACWISDQCALYGSKCFLKTNNTENLETVIMPLWDNYILSNGSQYLIPGICRCDNGHVYDIRQAKCIPRLINTRCRSSWPCLSRSLFSRCYHAKCVCTFGYTYNARSNDCVYSGEPMWPRRTCSDGSCQGNSSGSLNYERKVVFDYFFVLLSVVIFIMLFVLINNCTILHDKARRIRLNDLHYTELRVTYDSFGSGNGTDFNNSRQLNQLETLPSYEDIQPPSYSEATVKMPETTLTHIDNNIASNSMQ